jgi:hypothetical protein
MSFNSSYFHFFDSAEGMDRPGTGISGFDSLHSPLNGLLLDLECPFK